ncbi:hypothetical protein BDE36_1699 [Arcticibacter tournemirensis]|uniref:GLPGLI family protein n=1 Tax=Arcticibacter tournemirensis TaxID=699437 RepID=A0A5M9HA57_9SPHI|nr:hypothetical protein [Arcticibacter tournemirensis]KAA8483823.1 hypothetical protein F1649_08045 [Arcticibacter tournemirensis]TQM49967.1 hypothetical protein BDE36_1699 [Arcticibacter tournemirensis]
MRRSVYFLAIGLFMCMNTMAQHSDPPNSAQTFIKLQDSLKNLGYQVVNNPSEAERYNASYTMIKTLVSALKLNNSFNFGFDSLKTISILTSPDRRFRIFSWHVLNNDGSYRYYGTIQMNNAGGRLQMFPLVDHSAEIKNPQDSTLNSGHWYGAQYYKVIPVTYNVKVPYYILLGWKGNTVKSTKKVIDILYFKDNKAWFGMPVFYGNKESVNKHRIVFEYNRQVSMMLNYIPAEGMIVFDHLVPPSTEMAGSPELFGPDLSYDGFKIDRGRLKFVDNLELKNSPSEIDDLYNDPKKPSKEIINKLK